MNMKNDNIKKLHIMKQAFTLVGLLGLMGLFSGCEEYRCIKGDDNLKIETRRLENPVNRIFLESNYDIYVTQDTVLKLTVEADENLMPYIVTDVIEDDLYLTTANDRCVRSRNDIRVNLSTPDLTKVHLEGSGDIIINELVTTENVEFKNTGSGRIRCYYLFSNDLIVDILGSGDIIMDEIDVIDLDILNGGSGDFEVINESSGDFGVFVVDGSGDILADYVRLDELDVDISGSGDITCWVERLLYGEITGSGNVYYRSLPLRDIRIDLRGSGNVLPL